MLESISGSYLTYILQNEDEDKKIEKILYRRFHFSRKLIQKIKIGENAWLDGKFVFLNTRGSAGQTLTVNILTGELSTIEGENGPIDILFEDDLFLAVNKLPGQTVHPTLRYPSGTLANAVVGYWERKNEFRPFRPISRIDRNTSGIVLVAKTRFAHQQLAWQAGKNQVEKKYLGIVQGQFPKDCGEFSSPIALQQGSKIKREINEKGQTALTLFRVLLRHKNYSLMEFTLVTGRTHQIRVHCQGSGYPLLGDDLYGGDMSYIQRQALHCSSYSFMHPLKQERINIGVSLPEDMRLLLD
ncbi:MAG: Ribosomal large subunit pseudouridine synthase D [Candidatus Dichloromethanomonas elyunquensis]|nr:MAG: Ribosomal large subunit pseudouridine synthase D [Candidatus Dichloromethanomonas elyunquensis]